MTDQPARTGDRPGEAKPEQSAGTAPKHEREMTKGKDHRYNPGQAHFEFDPANPNARTDGGEPQ